MQPRAWSQTEVESIVEDYFQMLRLELTCQQYSKADHRRQLMECLVNRSSGSVEFKHQNISAVLIEMGIPYIDGYKPRSNYQQDLASGVKDYLEKNPEIQRLLSSETAKVPAAPSIEDWLDIEVDPPQPSNPATPQARERSVIYNPNGINYLEREARNQQLGSAGEEFILNFERARLIRQGNESLADKIEQVSETQGPAAGFDILSFEKNGTDRFIEVKTTKYGKNTPFFVTRNELAFSESKADRYHLYRLFRFSKDQPRLFTLQGNLQINFRLEPTEFQARV